MLMDIGLDLYRLFPSVVVVLCILDSQSISTAV